MALDFQNYLFSSTPPDYELCSSLYLSYRRRSPPRISVTGIAACETDDGFVDSSFESFHLGEASDDQSSDHCEGFGLTKSTNRCDDTDRIQSWETAYDCDSDKCTCSRKRENERRSVTFADTAGLALSTVRVIQETSDDPPDFQAKIVSSDEHANQSFSNHLVSPPSLQLIVKFQQPVAHYVSFQKKLMAECVSLENVVVRNGLQLVGTIKVKNIACNKAVTIRCTFDSWSNYQDIAAKPVDSDLSTFGLFVTFTFEITFPPTVSTTPGAVQFAVCYAADGQEFWDNNDNENYVVDVQCDVNQVENAHMQNRMKRESVFASHESTAWSQFAGWSDLDSESPYW